MDDKPLPPQHGTFPVMKVGISSRALSSHDAHQTDEHHYWSRPA